MKLSGLAQGVKDPAMPRAVMQVEDVARIPHCCGCGVGQQPQLTFDPSLGTSICYRCGPNMQNNNNNNELTINLRNRWPLVGCMCGWLDFKEK